MVDTWQKVMISGISFCRLFAIYMHNYMSDMWIVPQGQFGLFTVLRAFFFLSQLFCGCTFCSCIMFTHDLTCFI